MSSITRLSCSIAKTISFKANLSSLLSTAKEEAAMVLIVLVELTLVPLEECKFQVLMDSLDFKMFLQAVLWQIVMKISMNTKLMEILM